MTTPTLPPRRGRPPLANPRDVMITLRLTEAERVTLTVAAAREHRPFAQWARLVLLLEAARAGKPPK